jgi:hypothetical protein
MKKILLIGDSIRMGYDKYVKEALSGVAEVYYPSDNCMYAENVLRFAHEWIQKTGTDELDLIHWNAGLWDTLELFEDEPMTSLDYYGEAIARIHKRMKLVCPKTKLVFATSTAVLEDRCSKDFRRHNATIKKYNERALEALLGTDEIINDLYTLTENLSRDCHSDAVHYYTDKGTEAIGGRVLSIICRELGIEASEVNLDSFEPEKYSKDNIGF